MWVKTPRITSYHTPLLTWGNMDSNGNLWKMMLDFNDGPNGMLAIGLSGQRKTGGRYPLGDNMWRHLAVTLSEKLENTQEVSIFIDGYREELHYKNIDFSNFSIDTRSSDLVIGGDGFYGMIDDVRIYSDLLNPGEILRIYQESSLEDLNLYNSDYTLSVWVKPDDLPASNKYGFATGRFYWRNWGGEIRAQKWPQDEVRGDIPKFSPSTEKLSELFQDPIDLYLFETSNFQDGSKIVGADNWGSWSISGPGGFLEDDDPSDYSFIMRIPAGDPDGEPAFVTDYQDTLSKEPTYFASSLNTEYSGTWPQGAFMARGSLNIDNSVGPGLYYFYAGGGGWSSFWLDQNQDLGWETSPERIIHNIGGWGWDRSNSMNLVFLGHQNPIIMTPGMAGNQGLAIGPEQSAASWKGTSEEGLQAYRERAWALGEWHHLATTYDHEKLRLATYLNGKLIGSQNLTPETLLDHRWGDWYLGGPGAFGSDQFFAGQMDDLRIHDAALTPDQIFAIYNGGEGDIGVTGQLTPLWLPKIKPLSFPWLSVSTDRLFRLAALPRRRLMPV